ncbi:hypothetical protein V6N13_074095 [Hibiscus sabdariffa]
MFKAATAVEPTAVRVWSRQSCCSHVLEKKTDPPDDRLSDLTQQLIEQDQIRLDLHLSLGVGPNLGHSTQLPKPTLLSA